MHTVGRLIAIILFVAVMVPSGLLARGWARAADRRAVAGGGVELVPPSDAGAAVLARQARHGRRVRQLGFLLGLGLIVASVVVFAEASVFLWLPALVVGLLVGVLLAEATRPRPRWSTALGTRRQRRGEQISPWLLWTMRGAAAGELVLAWMLHSSGRLDGAVTGVALVVPAGAWLLAEVALLRVLVRPLAGDGADVPVDEALRTWTAHLVTAAVSVLALVPLGALLLVAGIDLGDRVSDGVDLVPVALVAGGFSAITAGLAVAGFLLTWLRPVRHTAPALAG